MLNKLTKLERERLAVIGRSPEGDMLKAIFKRGLESADEKNRHAVGVALIQSQGHAQVFEVLIALLEGQAGSLRQQRTVAQEEVLFGE